MTDWNLDGNASWLQCLWGGHSHWVSLCRRVPQPQPLLLHLQDFLLCHPTLPPNCVLLKLCPSRTLLVPSHFSARDSHSAHPAREKSRTAFPFPPQSSSASYEVGPTSVLPSDLMTVLRIPRGLRCLRFSLPLGSLRNEVTGPPIYSGHCFLSFRLHSSRLTRPS